MRGRDRRSAADGSIQRRRIDRPCRRPWICGGFEPPPLPRRVTNTTGRRHVDMTSGPCPPRGGARSRSRRRYARPAPGGGGTARLGSSRAHRRSTCTCTFSFGASSWRTRGRSQRSTADSDGKPVSSRFRRRVGVESSSSVEPTQATSVDGGREKVAAACSRWLESFAPPALAANAIQLGS